MADRQQIQADLEAKLEAGGKKVDEIKAKMAEAGSDVSDEAKNALVQAEKVLEEGKNKLSELAAASDEAFDDAWEKTQDVWNDLSSQVEGGWASVTEKVKGMFS